MAEADAGTPGALFEREVVRIREAIDAYTGESPAHIAVIAEPFAGQSMLMQQIIRFYPHRVTHLPFYSVVRNTGFLDTMRRTEDIVLVEGCHFLALRRIGGFAMLDAFLELLGTSEKLFITGWNSFMWSYLNAVTRLEEHFPVVIRLPRIDNATLKAMILSQYDQSILFVDDTPPEEKRRFSIERRLVDLPFSGSPVTLPWPKIAPRAAASGNVAETAEAAEDAIFDRINRIALGNYGVALRIWERSLVSDTVRMSSIPANPCTVSLTIDEAFLLAVILSMESISFGDLEEIAHTDIDVRQVLYRLRVQGLIEEERDSYRVKPEALHCVSAYLQKIRMVW